MPETPGRYTKICGRRSTPAAPLARLDHRGAFSANRIHERNGMRGTQVALRYRA
jgi:hypothetical protein